MKPAPVLERWLTVDEVAAALGLAPVTVRTKWQDKPDLVRAARKRGRTLRFDADAIAAIQRKARVQ